MTKEAAAANRPLVDRPDGGAAAFASAGIAGVAPADALELAAALPTAALQENSGSAIRAAAPWPLAAVDILSGMD